MIDTHRIAQALASGPEVGVRLRQAVVDTNNGDGTIDLVLADSGVVIPDVALLDGSYAPAGASVWVLQQPTGDLIALGSLATQPTAWTDYTPTITNVTVGNGVLVAKWAKRGPQALVEVQLQFGTTTSISGNPIISTPTTGAGLDFPASAENYRGFAFFKDDSTNARYPGVCRVTTSSIVPVYHNGAIQGALSATAPFTWTTGDLLHVSVAMPVD